MSDFRSSEFPNNSDTISRQAAIDALARMMPRSYTPDGSHPADEEIFRAQEVFADCIEALEILPSAQPEQPTGVQDILQYLDEYLHPIVSPEHWSVYSELYDMVSMLPSEQPERKKGRWIGGEIGRCSVCGHEGCASDIWNNCERKFCPNCGSYNGGDGDDQH